MGSTGSMASRGSMGPTGSMGCTEYTGSAESMISTWISTGFVSSRHAYFVTFFPR